MKRIALILVAVSFLICQLSAGVAISENLGDQILPSFHEKDQINNPKLSPAFNRLVQELKTDGVRGAQDYGESRALDMDNGLVWAVIEVDADSSVNLSEELQVQIRERIEALGGVWELVYRNRIQVWLPLEALEDVASWPNINLIREPFKPIPPDDPRKLILQDSGSEEGQLRTTEAVEVVSQGVSLIGAGTWHSSGYNGSGVKVAVIDLGGGDGGFKGYTSLLGTELPSSGLVKTKAYGDFYTGPHGTACAEIIHDVAPGASLYLTQPRNNTELGDAIDWCKAQGVKIISYSVGWFYQAGQLDGKGITNDIVDDANSHGIIWVNSSGNAAKNHWGGNFNDPDSNGWHNYIGTNETNIIQNPSDNVQVYLMWLDPWWGSTNDYDLVIFQNYTTVKALSVVRQTGSSHPLEHCSFVPSLGQTYDVGIKKYSGISKMLHLFVPECSSLERSIPVTSLLIPADNENAITVGAVAWNSPSTIEPYSSQGPTTDGRIKPDLVAPDKVSTVSYGTSAFSGTSASCPHVAGACALVLQKNPSWTPAQVKSYLEANAEDIMPPGKDNVYGSGRLHLPDPGSGPVGENTYYIPYFVANSPFGTGLGLTNLGTGTAHVTISIYNQAGTLLKNETKTIAPRAQTAFLTGSDLAGNEGWMKITSDERVTGICLVARARPLNLMFDITMIPKLCTSLIVPHVAQNSMWDTHILLCNPNGSSASVTFTFVGGDGVVKGNRVITIPKNGSTKVPVSTLATNPGNGRVEISADKGVAAFALYLDLKDGGYSYAGLSAIDPSDY